MNTKKAQTNWIWISPWGEKENILPRVICFRKSFMLKDLDMHCKIRITADSRYKLYVNGHFLQEGPSKGNLEIWYVDQADLAPYLTVGENVVAVEVLRYPADMAKRNHSLYRTENPCLYVEEMNESKNKESDLLLDAAFDWKCFIHPGISFVEEPFRPAPLHILENTAGLVFLGGWKLPGYDDTKWTPAIPYAPSFAATRIAESPFHLVDRTIPAQMHAERTFTETVCIRKGTLSKDQWNLLLSHEKKILIPPHSTQIIEIDAGELMTGYLEFAFEAGRDSQITVHTAECYSYENPSPASSSHQRIRKGDRTDWVNGQLHGVCDHYMISGYGTGDLPEEWEPYWFRTFRYIGLTIETSETPLLFTRLSYRETGYPLEVKTHVITSDQSLTSIWDISERTLRRCMHETYFDCPFYEQLQYAMDARSEILFTYAIAADDRLARKTMEDFRYSQRSDGLINSCAPSVRTNVIPGFSIFYLLMVHDHMMFFGDKKLVRHHLPAIDSILEFFDQNLTLQGLVGRVGGPLMRSKYWSFIDWTPQWDSTRGVPTACLKKSGSITMESLLYLTGLTAAAELADYAGRSDTAGEYRKRASELKQAVLSYCMGNYTMADGTVIHLIQDGPGVEEYSVHCQVFAILNDLVTNEDGKEMLAAVLDKPEEFVPCSVAMKFYLFRALEKVNWYEKTNDLWNLWREMLANHMTTCMEKDSNSRSDCHAWASTILYELPCVSLGVTSYNLPHGMALSE